MTTEQLEGIRVRMPALGESVDEGTITRWLKQPGDPVLAEEPLLKVATDKVDIEIPSPVGGMLHRILAEENDVVAIGADLAIVVASSGGPVADAPAPPPPPADPAPAETAVPPAPSGAPTEKLPRIRRTIAQRMVESLQTSAQLTTVVEVDVTAIARRGPPTRMTSYSGPGSSSRSCRSSPERPSTR